MSSLPRQQPWWQLAHWPSPNLCAAGIAGSSSRTVPVRLAERLIPREAEVSAAPHTGPSCRRLVAGKCYLAGRDRKLLWERSLKRQPLPPGRRQSDEQGSTVCRCCDGIFATERNRSTTEPGIPPASRSADWAPAVTECPQCTVDAGPAIVSPRSTATPDTRPPHVRHHRLTRCRPRSWPTAVERNHSRSDFGVHGARPAGQTPAPEPTTQPAFGFASVRSRSGEPVDPQVDRHARTSGGP